MLAGLQAILRDDGFQSGVFQRWQPLYRRLFDSRWTILVLLLLGIGRAIFFSRAYAPADGADAMDYYTYAAYISGVDLPAQAANVSPLYPLFIYVNHYVLGHFDLIFLWQMMMSASFGLLFYIGLRRYNTLFALLVALMVIADAQTGTLFNFASTEPLYLFLLACLYSLTLVQHASTATRVIQIRDILIGVLLVLLRETRTVGRYLIIPLWVLFALATRDWKRAGIVLVSFGIMAMLFNVSTKITKSAQQASANDTMLLRPLLEQRLLSAEAGTASADLANAIAACRKNDEFVRLFSCLEATYGGEAAALDMLNAAYAESVVERPLAIYRRIFTQFTAFLQLSGRQVHGTPTPADVQCEDIPARVQRQVEHMFAHEWQSIPLNETQHTDYIRVVEDFAYQMCPPAPTNQTIHDITDYIALRYRSLSRPHPYRWYLTLVVLVLLVPWARKLWLPVFLAGAILSYHAAVSAALFNVQARYVVVTNPFKGVLILALLVILGYLVLKIIDMRLRRKAVVRDTSSL